MAYLLWHYLTDSVQRYPSKPAVAWRETVLSYRELDDQSTRVAHLLMARGIGRGHRVGLYMPKSSRSVVGMLGILKTGAAYVPVDSDAPPRRVAFILNNCTVSGLLTPPHNLSALSEFLSELRALHTILLTEDSTGVFPPGEHARIHQWGELAHVEVTEPLPASGVETDPAYLLYTSGSTGDPKGVILSHRHAMTFVEWGAKTFAVCSEDRLSNHAPLHFDLSVFDVYVALRSGACVVMVPDEIAPFPMELARWIDAQEISVWYSVPSALIRLLLHGKLDRYTYTNLRTILYAGEVFPVKYLREVMATLQHVKFFNLYGPTETNVCTYFPIPNPLDPASTNIPIGKACANTDVFAVDETGQVIPPEATGELLVKGPSVMLGYWGLPEKVDAVLVPNPLQSAYQEKVYRTGDMVSVNADGNYIFEGRKDNMVKTRGYRVELGEIEQMLYRHDQVREAAALALPDDEIGARLAAVVVPHQEGAVSASELAGFCRARLPKYMVPEEIAFLAELPKTSTGKINRLELRKAFERNNVGGKAL